MCSVAVPVAVLENVDRARRHAMWRKYDSNAKSKPLVAWRVYKAKKERWAGDNQSQESEHCLTPQISRHFLTSTTFPGSNLYGTRITLMGSYHDQKTRKVPSGGKTF
jgi:hypothetical protein